MKTLNRLLNHKENASASLLAKRAGIHAGNLSEIRQGKRGVNREIVGKLVNSGIWTPAEATQLLVAFLRDEIPDGCQDFVTVAGATLAEELLKDGDFGITEDERALAFFRERCASNPEFADWFVGLYRQLSGKP